MLLMTRDSFYEVRRARSRGCPIRLACHDTAGRRRGGHMQKSMNAFQQIMARKGRPIVICTQVRMCIRCVSERDDNAYAERGHRGGLCMQGDAAALKGVSTIEIPPIVDCLGGILAVLPFQLISYHLAVERGYNVRFGQSVAKRGRVLRITRGPGGVLLMTGRHASQPCQVRHGRVAFESPSMQSMHGRSPGPP